MNKKESKVLIVSVSVILASVVLIAMILVDSGFFLNTEEKLTEMGYNTSEVSEILAKDEETQKKYLSGEYDRTILSIASLPGYDEEKAIAYQAFNKLTPQEYLDYTNRHLLNESNYQVLCDLKTDPYYLESRLERYLANPKENTRMTVEYVNCDADLTPFDQSRASALDANLLVEVNKYYYLPQDYEPEDMVTISGEYGISTTLRQVAYEAYTRMADDARAQGLNFNIVSAFRSYDKQRSLYDNYVAKDGVEKADTYSARPGYSDHQSGLTVDVLAPGTDFGSFTSSDEAKWLAEHAAEYGFILRYPQGKEDVTKYVYESWHFRYVGEVAKEIKDKGITFDEYYTYYVAKN